MQIELNDLELCKGVSGERWTVCHPNGSFFFTIAKRKKGEKYCVLRVVKNQHGEEHVREVPPFGMTPKHVLDKWKMGLFGRQY